MIPDYAKTVKDALRANDPPFDATLQVDDDYTPVAGAPIVLVADDGGPSMIQDSWMVGSSPQRTVLRMTGFAEGRTEARATVVAAWDVVIAQRPGIARIEADYTLMLTRDKSTGAWLASAWAPVIIRHQ